ncbi:MAG: hypothetical protein WCW31_03975 [Patescibacteria group bacterium]|jgi:hypothetical protein
MKQVVVFLPSEIYTMHPPYPAAVPKYQLNLKADGEYEYKYYSTGRLEAAIAAGYEVYVLNATPEGRPYAEWWLALVPADHVLSIDGFETMESGSVNDAFMELYSKLGLPWNENAKLWPTHLYALSNYNIKRGYQIEPLVAGFIHN